MYCILLFVWYCFTLHVFNFCICLARGTARLEAARLENPKVHINTLNEYIELLKLHLNELIGCRASRRPLAVGRRPGLAVCRGRGARATFV